MLPVYVDDLVEALLLAAAEGAPGRAYTAWDGEPVSFGEYFGRIAAITGTAEPRRLPRPALEALGAISETWARLRGRPPAFTARSPTFIARRGTVSTARIREELGWRPRVPLAEGLRRSEKWARDEGLLD
jgi:nucleoside-diphosphate-sugar epimerase